MNSHRDYESIHIRDNVHGDILIPQKFVNIINTPEFQRLRRIRQLATAQYVFPCADHTRFTHSIGTFAVMQQIITHFNQYFLLLGRSDLITEEKKNILLAAALLHDVGHTPFSHAMEDVLPNAQKIPHERWTIDIIQNTEGSLFHALENNFGKGFSKKVADFILLQHEPDNGPRFLAKDLNLNNIFRSLISSQIDADRLDYIRRDSLTAGVTYGLIDVARLISGFRIGILKDGEATVCISQEYLPDIEGYLYARYQMYRNVYFHPFKILTEELLKKIIRTVYTLYEQDKINASDLPAGFKAALQQPRMSIEDFLSLDDYVIMGAIKGWAKLTDERTIVLQNLCQCLINRTGFRRYIFSDVSYYALSGFKVALFHLLKPYLSESVAEEEIESWIDSASFLVVKTANPTLYKPGLNSIYVMESTGRLVEISDCSGLIRAFEEEKIDSAPETSLQDIGFTSDLPTVSAIYFSEILLRASLEQQSYFSKMEEDAKKRAIDEVIKNVEQLFEHRSSKNMIEIEKKYSVFDRDSYRAMREDDRDKILSSLANLGYDHDEPRVIDQIDRYLDTEDKRLHKEHCTLRIRIRSGEVEITCKKPVIGSRSCGRDGQMERYEYNRKLNAIDINKPEELYLSPESKAFIQQYLPLRVEELRESLVIRNTRTQYTVFKLAAPKEVHDKENFREQYELAFDSVKYENLLTGKTYKEQQIELELKASAIYRLNMQLMTDKIESDVSSDLQLVKITDSKYERAIRFTE